jgi:Fe-S cluster assembly iron-binding protein IscA
MGIRWLERLGANMTVLELANELDKIIKQGEGNLEIRHDSYECLEDFPIDIVKKREYNGNEYYVVVDEANCG